MMIILLLLAIYCLFILKINNDIDQYSNFLEIPEELYKHMVNKSNLFIISGSKDEISGHTFNARVGVTKSNIDEKYYFFCRRQHLL